jgi:serine/threonine protein kinase
MATTSSTFAREADAPRVPFGRRTSVDLTGRSIDGRYRLRRRLGAGGMSTIYEAEHTSQRRRVALKVLDAGPAAERFLQEAHAAASLRSEHVIDVIDYGRGRDELGREHAFIAMECLDGEDLAATLEHDGPLRWTRVLRIGEQVCEALVAAHARGVVHCDIKPGNCFRITREGTADFIKILDFGVASFADKETGQCVPPAPPQGDGRRKSGPLGTPGYMPEEQLSGGPYDHRVDIFALGVLMYRLLTGKMPYAAGSVYMPRRPQSGPLPIARVAPAVEIPAELEAVILKSVAAEPDARFQSAQEMLAALHAAEEATMPPSRLPHDPLQWGEEEPASSMSATDAHHAALSHTELSLSHGRVELEPTRRPRRPLPPGLWMLAGFVGSLVTTSALRLLLG